LLSASELFAAQFFSTLKTPAQPAASLSASHPPLTYFSVQGMSVELHAGDQSHQTLFTVGLVDLAAAGVERVVITERCRVGDGHWWTALVYVDGQCLEASALGAFVNRPNQLVTQGYALSKRLRELASTLTP